MQAFIENIQQFCVHDGPGTRTTIFFKGCPLSCLWCSNPTTQRFGQDVLFNADKCLMCGSCLETCQHEAISFNQAHKPIVNRNKCELCGECMQTCPSRARSMCAKQYSVDEVFKIIKKDLLFFHNSGGGVTFSGGEMLCQHEFVLEVIQRCKNLNIHTAAETSGFGKYEIAKSVIKELDYLFYDLKHLDSDEHKKITGQENILIIKNLLQLLEEVPTPIHLRLPLIPTLNDDLDHLKRYAEFVSSLKGIQDLEILPYHALGTKKYSLLNEEYPLKHIKPHSREDLTIRVELMRKHAKNVNIICHA